MATPPVALDIRSPAQQPGPLDLYKEGLSVQSMINQQALQKQAQQANVTAQQSNDLALKQQQQDSDDRDKFNKVFHDANGDWDQAIKNAPGAGVSGQGVIKLQLARTDQVAKMATMNKELLTNESTKADQLAKDAQVVLAADPDEKQNIYAKLRNGHLATGAYSATDLPVNVPADDELKATVAHSKAAQDMIKEATALQEQKAKLPGEQAESTAKGYSTAAQTMGGANEQLGWTARRNLAVKNNADMAQLIPEQYSPAAAEQVRQLGIAPKDLANQAPDKLELASFLKSPPPGYKATPVEFLRYQKSVTPILNFNLSNATGAGTGPGGGAPAPADVARRFGMTPEAFDQTAEKYASTGAMPSVGRGPSGIALQRAIMNRAGELHAGESLAANSAEFKANQSSLGNIQKTFDNVTAFENTAGKNLDVFLNQAKKAIDTGLPIANLPARFVAGKLGSTDQAAFETARTTAITEIAKVLSSANAGSGVLSDGARHEVEGLIKGDATLGQIMSAANILKQDMANRHESYAGQISDIQKRMGAKAPQTQSSTETNAVPPNVTKVLSGVGTGRHKLSDGSVWDKKADGSIVKAS
jgi:hypothetical protein